MNRLHFEVESLSIDSMLRASVEFEVFGLMIGISSKNGVSKVGLEGARVDGVNGNFCCVTSPFNSRYSLVGIPFLESIFRLIIDSVFIVFGSSVNCDQVDWGLIGVTTSRVIKIPVRTVKGIIVGEISNRSLCR